MGVRLYIKGKPWVISIDEYSLFYGYGNKVLKFGKESLDDRAIWGSVLEKAWAKARGNYVRANGDTNVNGISTLTGVPVFDYKCSDITTNSEVTSAYNLMKAGEDAHYIMSAQTAGGTDTTYNRCGIANGHAYSIISAFLLTDQYGT